MEPFPGELYREKALYRLNAQTSFKKAGLRLLTQDYFLAWTQATRENTPLANKAKALQHYEEEALLLRPTRQGLRRKCS